MRPQTSLQPVRISRAHWDELVAHAREDAPNECCGYLWATDGAVEGVKRAENPRKSPYGYELDHRSLFAANELDDEGFEVGIYHSHPRSPAEPSQTDINLATYPALALPDRLLGERAGGAGVADRRRPRGGGGARRRRRLTSRSPARLRPRGRLRRELLPELRHAARAPGGEPLEAPLSDAHGRARKIDPAFTEGELVRVAGGRNQAEAELIQGLLLEWGVPSMLRRSAGFDVPDFLAAGPRDVLVPAAGAETAREVLLQADLAPTTGERPRPAPAGARGRGRARRGRAPRWSRGWPFRAPEQHRAVGSPAMDFAPSDRVAELLDRVREFMEEHVDPVEREAIEALDDEVRPGRSVPARSWSSCASARRPRASGTCSCRTTASAPGSPTGSTGCSAS